MLVSHAIDPSMKCGDPLGKQWSIILVDRER
jgi:hypothetical protein